MKTSTSKNVNWIDKSDKICTMLSWQLDIEATKPQYQNQNGWISEMNSDFQLKLQQY